MLHGCRTRGSLGRLVLVYVREVAIVYSIAFVANGTRERHWVIGSSREAAGIDAIF